MDGLHAEVLEAGESARVRPSSSKASPAKVSDLIATALAIQEEDAAASGQIGYMARAMIWASMPHKKIEPSAKSPPASVIAVAAA